MSTTLDEPIARPSTSPTQRLRATMAGVRLSISWLGVRKSLSRSQKSQAADTFGADSDYVSAAKKLLDTTHPAFKAVSAVRHRIVSLFKGMSLPYPEPGVRLIRQGDIALFNVQMQTLKAELEEAVEKLDEQYAELRSAARRRLGSLYDAGDYPVSLDGLFDVQWDFPAFEPPNYLRQLSPELYEQECQRVAGRFDEAVRLAEEAFTEELAKLTSHLTERLAGAEDGKQKVFRDSAVENLTEFFDRFRHLNLSSDSQLDELVDQAQRVVRGVGPQQLRDDQTLRQHVATELSAVQSVLDGLLVDRPRRNILRRPK
jgi:hypothetical protein